MIKQLISLLFATAAIANPIRLQQRTDSFLGFDYNSDKVRGVNIGGWLVIEPFINPSLFTDVVNSTGETPVDEWHYSAALGKELTLSRLSEHWASWFTEQDFKDIANNYKMNHVRIPIGYWAFVSLDGDPYVQGQEEYLDKAITWARDAGLKVWIDLHGVPGSQNGFDNSGLRDVYDWQPSEAHINTTLEVLTYIANKYSGSDYNDVVTGIELVNEPLGPILDMDKLKDFYHKGYEIVRASNYGSVVGVVMHDAFMEIGYWNDFAQVPDYWNVVLDHHKYQIFSTPELQRTLDEHIDYTCQTGRNYSTENLWRVTGEWSAALTDCTKWINGVGRGSRYDATYDNTEYIGSCEGTDDITTWSDDRKAATRKYIEAQMDAYEQGAGWVIWTYKTEASLEWSVMDLAAAGLFPVPVTDRKYPNQCGY